MEDFILLGQNDRITIRAASFQRRQDGIEFYDAEGNMVGSFLYHLFHGIVKADALQPNA